MTEHNNTPLNQDEYLRALMPDASEAEIGEAKRAVQDFLQMVLKLREEREKEEKLDQTLLDLLV
jgi:hypothetical protein